MGDYQRIGCLEMKLRSFASHCFLSKAQWAYIHLLLKLGTAPLAQPHFELGKDASLLLLGSFHRELVLHKESISMGSTREQLAYSFWLLLSLFTLFLTNFLNSIYSFCQVSDFVIVSAILRRKTFCVASFLISIVLRSFSFILVILSILYTEGKIYF